MKSSSTTIYYISTLYETQQTLKVSMSKSKHTKLIYTYFINKCNICTDLPMKQGLCVQIPIYQITSWIYIFVRILYSVYLVCRIGVITNFFSQTSLVFILKNEYHLKHGWHALSGKSKWHSHSLWNVWTMVLFIYIHMQHTHALKS